MSQSGGLAIAEVISVLLARFPNLTWFWDYDLRMRVWHVGWQRDWQDVRYDGVSSLDERLSVPEALEVVEYEMRARLRNLYYYNM